jgi:hypothetical protein
MAKRFSPVVWWSTPVEIHSAIARLQRARKLNDREVRFAADRLQAMRQGWYEILPGNAVRDLAQDLLYLHPLRAADSLQLAAALTWCRNRPANRTFLTADIRLGEAANHAGFTVLNP